MLRGNLVWHSVQERQQRSLQIKTQLHCPGIQHHGRRAAVVQRSSGVTAEKYMDIVDLVIGKPSSSLLVPCKTEVCDFIAREGIRDSHCG